MSRDGLPSSEKVHTVKVEGKSEGMPVNGDIGLRLTSEKMMTYKGSPTESSFGEDTPMLKSIRWLTRKE